MKEQYTIKLYLCKHLTDPWGNYFVSSVSEQRETKKKPKKLAGQSDSVNNNNNLRQLTWCPQGNFLLSFHKLHAHKQVEGMEF